MDTRLAVVIMAAGKGTRMNNPAMAKVLYTINERPMIDWVVDLAERLDAFAAELEGVGPGVGGLKAGQAGPAAANYVNVFSICAATSSANVSRRCARIRMFCKN